MKTIVYDIETRTLELPSWRVDQHNKSWKPPANYRDPVKIEEKRKGDLEALGEKTQFDFYRHEIVSLASYCLETQQLFCLTLLDDPREILSQWDEWVRDQVGSDLMQLVTWSGSQFDDRVILAHRVRFGLEPLVQCSRRIDLCQDYKSPWKGLGLKTAALGLGLEIDTPDIDGSDVQSLIDAGDKETIRLYNISDVKILSKLFNIYETYYK